MHVLHANLLFWLCQFRACTTQEYLQEIFQLFVSPFLAEKTKGLCQSGNMYAKVKTHARCVSWHTYMCPKNGIRSSGFSCGHQLDKSSHTEEWSSLRADEMPWAKWLVWRSQLHWKLAIFWPLQLRTSVMLGVHVVCNTHLQSAKTHECRLIFPAEIICFVYHRNSKCIKDTCICHVSFQQESFSVVVFFFQWRSCGKQTRSFPFWKFCAQQALAKKQTFTIHVSRREKSCSWCQWMLTDTRSFSTMQAKTWWAPCTSCTTFEHVFPCECMTTEKHAHQDSARLQVGVCLEVLHLRAWHSGGVDAGVGVGLHTMGEHPTFSAVLRLLLVTHLIHGGPDPTSRILGTCLYFPPETIS